MRVWAFVGENDTIVDPSASTAFIAQLSGINPSCRVTEMKGCTHFDVINAYLSEEYDLIGWLLSE